MKSTKIKWTTKWPTEPGRYWFFGWPYGSTIDFNGKPIQPELHCVTV